MRTKILLTWQERKRSEKLQAESDQESLEQEAQLRAQFARTHEKYTKQAQGSALETTGGQYRQAIEKHEDRARPVAQERFGTALQTTKERLEDYERSRRQEGEKRAQNEETEKQTAYVQRLEKKVNEARTALEKAEDAKDNRQINICRDTLRYATNDLLRAKTAWK